MENSSNYPILISELKKVLKRKKKKYSDIARELDMSESSVKRLMSGKDASLSKLEALCRVVDITFFDLVSMSKDSKPQTLTLTKEQDRFFAKNTNYFYFYHLIHEEDATVQEIVTRFGLSEKSKNKYLKKLEDLGLLEWHPGDKIVIVKKGGIHLPEMTELGSHLVRTLMKNVTELVGDVKKMDEQLKDKNGTFHIGEYYLREETAKGFQNRISNLLIDMEKASDRESRIYGKEELKFYTSISSVMPMRFYCENIPNI
ncbi:MAG: helix-turn-helix domain-containing protein [Oligoflexia bacterium]|nr:helix-turn-helix domain-containing protein [Oligoflexia bacterium]